MASFGERLRRERESRDIRLGEIAETTKIGVRYLDALEHNDFGKLPGGVFNKGYVRAFAQYLGMDPEIMIQAYLEECGARNGEAPDDPTRAETSPSDVARRLAEHLSRTESRSSRRWVRAAGALGLIAIAAAGAWAVLRFGPGVIGRGTSEPATVQRAAVTLTPKTSSSGNEPVAGPAAPATVEPTRSTRTEPVVRTPSTMPRPGERNEATPTSPPPVASSGTTVEPSAVKTPVEPPVAAPPKPRASEPAAPVVTNVDPRLSVTEFGVGTAVVNRQLQGKSDRFEEGAQVWFWTRVLGGEQGDRIRHVWLRDGVEVSSIELSVGGPHWRTQSRALLRLGSSGAWAVEVRDAQDRVLAREEFRVGSGESDGSEFSL